MTADTQLDKSGSIMGEPLPLGPGSLTWELFGRLEVQLSAGSRTGMIQGMHPIVAGALLNGSRFMEDPLGRFQRSAEPIMKVLYGEDPDGAGLAIRDMHKGIKTIPMGPEDKVTGALNPEVFMFTHLTFIEVIVRAFELNFKPLSLEHKNQLLREGITWWRRFGMRDWPMPETWDEFEVYWKNLVDNVFESSIITDWNLGRGPIANPNPGLPRLVWALVHRPLLHWLVWDTKGATEPELRAILKYEWTAKDERRHLRYRKAKAWLIPRLPEKFRYSPGIYALRQAHPEEAKRYAHL